jgi:bacterioferritin (cytochrome b1)
MNIKIDVETTDSIVQDVLKEDYRMVRQNIRNIKNLMKSDKVKSYVVADLKYDKKLLKALARVLAYHMVHEDYVKFMKENK